VVDYAYINASPIIFLAQAGLLDMLRFAATEIRLTSAVEQEIGKKPASDLAVMAVVNRRLLAPKLHLSSLYTSPAKPKMPSFQQGCRNPVPWTVIRRYVSV